VIEFNLADIGEGIAECEVLRWFIAEGDTIAQFDKVCEVQSDKANVEITSRYDGKVVSLKYAVGELAKVGKPLLTLQLAGSSDPAVPGVGSIDVSNADMEEPRTPAAARPGLAQQLAAGELTDDARNTANDKVLSSPAVRRIAREEKVPLAQVAGTGPGGRILKEDVLNFIKNGRKPTAQAKAASAAAPTPLAYQAPPAYQAPAPVGKAAAPAAAAAAAPAAKSFAAPPQAITEDRVIPITYVQPLRQPVANACAVDVPLHPDIVFCSAGCSIYVHIVCVVRVYVSRSQRCESHHGADNDCRQCRSAVGLR
jgi:pyruvate/2-oxoglutarate dehydrogenase complex dihydrolipoamide acyltransferase (E2) component